MTKFAEKNDLLRMANFRNQAYLFRRYLWLYEAIASHQPITYEELVRLWERSSLCDGNTLPHKTFENHRKAVEELLGVNIHCDRSTNEYSLDDKLQSARSMLDSALLLNNIASSSEMQKYVSLETIQGSNEFLRIILTALADHNVLRIIYRHNYDHNCEESLFVKPIGIKLFRQRWYLVAEKSDNTPYSYALDRIVSLDSGDKCMPSSFDLNKLYADAYGIIREKNNHVESITIRVEREQANYFKNVPLHTSQTVVAEDNQSVTFTLNVSPTYDFIMEMLSHGAKVEVISPQRVRDIMKQRVDELSKLYK